VIVSTAAGALAFARRAHPASSIAKFHCSWANISVISLSIVNTDARALQIASDILGEVIPTVQPPNLAPGCSADSLINSNFRNSLFEFNTSCFTLVPRTAANDAYCDSAGRGFSAALAATTCANIRGNLGRDVAIGPGLFNMNFSVFKNNYIRKISETFNVQFRAEMFNVLNHTNFAPSSNLSPFNADGTRTSSFGQLTSTQGDNRVIQLALKLLW